MEANVNRRVKDALGEAMKLVGAAALLAAYAALAHWSHSDRIVANHQGSTYSLSTQIAPANFCDQNNIA